MTGPADFEHQDVAEVRAQTQALNALRETQLEQGQKLDSLSETVHTGFATLNIGMTRLEAILGRIASQETEPPAARDRRGPIRPSPVGGAVVQQPCLVMTGRRRVCV